MAMKNPNWAATNLYRTPVGCQHNGHQLFDPQLGPNWSFQVNHPGTGNQVLFYWRLFLLAHFMDNDQTEMNLLTWRFPEVL